MSYAPLPDGTVGDVVTWRSKGRSGHIVGIDRPIDEGGWQFEWRGVEPLTRFVRSRWCFVAGDPTGWAVTLFEKTLFTAAGIDIYARDPAPDANSIDEARRAIAADPRTAPHAATLITPPIWRSLE